jgi:hypothetical protein
MNTVIKFHAVETIRIPFFGKFSIVKSSMPINRLLSFTFLNQANNVK